MQAWQRWEKLLQRDAVATLQSDCMQGVLHEQRWQMCESRHALRVGHRALQRPGAEPRAAAPLVSSATH